MFRHSIVQSTRQFSSSAARNSFARVQLLGRVGQEITESQSASGTTYVKYPIAVQTKKDSPVSWFNIISFNEGQNGFLTQYVKKGALVHVDATVRQDVYEKEDGTKVNNYTFVQSRVDLISNPRTEESE